jgi:putative SOS response-associated peptidase YedK
MLVDGKELIPLFDIGFVAAQLPVPSKNISPTQQVLMVLQSDKEGQQGRHLVAARWGLVAPFVKSISEGPTPFNARMETVSSNGLFRRAYASRRAIIPASGFYESHKPTRQPYYITPPQGVFAFAGLYEWWKTPAGGFLLSTTIITRPAQGKLAEIHEREPLLLAPDLFADWLDPSRKGDQELLETALAASTALSAATIIRKTKKFGFLP